MKNVTPHAHESPSSSSKQESPDTGGVPELALLLREKGRPAPSTVEHALPSGRRIEVALDAETVRIYSAAGQVELLISCTPAGCVLQFETANLSLRNQGKIDLQCEELKVETSKQLSLHSQGHVSTKAQAGYTTEVTGTLQTRADQIELTATTGDAVIAANDFVRVKGEEILLNSDDNPKEKAKQLEELWKKLCP